MRYVALGVFLIAAGLFLWPIALKLGRKLSDTLSAVNDEFLEENDADSTLGSDAMVRPDATETKDSTENHHG